MKDDFVFFWHGYNGHPNCEYGQWYIYDMEIKISDVVKELPFLQGWLDAGGENTIIFNCAEKWMMFNKAMLFQDLKSAVKVLATDSPKEQKALGKKVIDFNEDKWFFWNEHVIFIGNIYKFSDPKLKKLILSVPDGKKFVEASPFDKLYGIGLESDNPLAWDETTWNGKNLLGKCLNKVRDALK